MSPAAENRLSTVGGVSGPYLLSRQPAGELDGRFSDYRLESASIRPVLAASAKFS